MPDSQPHEPRQPDHSDDPDRSSRPDPSGRSDTADGGSPLILCGARLVDGRTVDVRVADGRIETVGTAGSLAPSGSGSTGGRVDLTGYLLLPAPAEPHAHHESALTAQAAISANSASTASPPSQLSPPRPSSPSSPSSSACPPSYDPPEVQRRTTEAALLQLGHGATAARSHVRIGGVSELRSLEAVLAARRALRGLVELTTVAVPRLLTGVAGADGLAMLHDAVKMGANVVGGCPDLDPDPGGYTEAVLGVAAEHGCAVDLHTDAGDPARLARLAAMAGGLRPGVTIGPCGGLAGLPWESAARAADQLAAAGVTVVALPQGDCCLAGRSAHPAPPAPASSRTAPVRLLRAAGVQVAAGSGALRDTANPVGRGDPLEAAYLLASLGEADPDAAYEAVSGRARAAMGLPKVRVEAGFPAELLAVRGQDVPGMLSLAYSRVVLHRGRVVARTSAVREFCDAGSGEDGESVAGFGLPRQAQG